MQHQLIFITSGVLACISLMPIATLLAGASFGGVVLLRTIREARQEIRRREEERYARVEP